jgi:hypothetical protein
MVLPTGSVARRKKSKMGTVSGTVVGGTVVGGTVVGGIVVGGAVVGVTVVGGVVVAGTVVGIAGWAQPQSNSIISATHKIRFIAGLLFLFHFPLDYSTKRNKKQGRLAIPPAECIMKSSNNKGCSYALPFPAFPRRQSQGLYHELR